MTQALAAILANVEASISRNGKKLADYIDLPNETTLVRFSDFGKHADITGLFDETCVISATAKAISQIEAGQLRITIRAMNATNRTISNAVVHINDQQGRLQIYFGSAGTIIIGTLGQATIDARVGHNGTLVIGDKTTINGARFIAVNNNILIGRDGLWSDEILVQGFDQHGIIDLKDRKFINTERRDVVLGDHVWVGRRAILMPSTTIGCGSIVGAGSVVTRSAPAFTAVAGNPARVVRTEVSWSRPWTHLDDLTQQFLDENARLE